MKTIENNRLIAEFMGFEMTHKINYIPSKYPDCIKNHEHLKVDNEDNLPFHSDWNWLMLVVEKIESIGHKVVITNHICRIEILLMDDIVVSEDMPKIKAVYNACILFIKWYNKNKTILNGITKTKQSLIN